MQLSYAIDLATFSLQSLHDTLAHGDLLPSHQPLRENLDAHFATLGARGIANVQQIVDALTTQKAVERFAKATGLPLDYLTLLRHHVRGYVPNPIRFADIPGIDPQTVERLAAVGIKHTHHFFERARTRAGRAALARETGITDALLLELTQLTDLACIGWVGPIGVRLFYEAGATTVKTLVALDPDTFHKRVNAVNQQRQYMRVTLGRKDIALCLDMAKKLPESIEF